MKTLNEDLFKSKVAKSKTRIYGTKENPLFVDASGKNKDIFPTLYCVMMYPDILTNNKRIVLKEGVERFLFKGSHLMWPGINNPNDIDVQVDEMVAI